MLKPESGKLFRVGEAFSVNVETGETTPIENGGFRMLPGPPGTCEWCHVKHDQDQPHNQQSLSYQIKFKAANGRWPTWTDAMAHCEQTVQKQWRQELIRIITERGLELPEDLRDGSGIQKDTNQES